jgi:hypothetical protein
MDRSTTSPDAQNEIEFLLSLLRISYPGETAPQAAGAIEQLLTATR